MNLQNVPCVANQQQSDAQDVKPSGTVKGICYFLNYACGTEIFCLVCWLTSGFWSLWLPPKLHCQDHLWHRINTEMLKELYKGKQLS